jgi:hypothetical protein
MPRTRKDGRPYARNDWHTYLMEVYSAAAQAWWERCEAATSLYETEVAEFKATNPPPLLRDFMVQMAPVGGWRATHRDRRAAA